MQREQHSEPLEATAGAEIAIKGHSLREAMGEEQKVDSDANDQHDSAGATRVGRIEEGQEDLRLKYREDGTCSIVWDLGHSL